MFKKLPIGLATVDSDIDAHMVRVAIIWNFGGL